MKCKNWIIIFLCIAIISISGCHSTKNDSVTLTNQKESNIKSEDNAYLSLTCRHGQRSAFLTYDLNKKKLEKVYSKEYLCSYPVGIVDKNNKKVYYCLYGNFNNNDAKAGDCLMCYDLKTKKESQVTPIHHGFNKIALNKNQLFLIAGGKESNGIIQLEKINISEKDKMDNPLIPIEPNDTDTVYKTCSVDYSNGDICAISYSDAADRAYMALEKEVPTPMILKEITPDFEKSKVLYTFSDSPYTSLYDNYSDDEQDYEKTENNLMVTEVSRLSDNDVLIYAAKNIYEEDGILKVLHLDTKTVEDYLIDGKKLNAVPIVSKDRKGVFLSVYEMKGKKNGMYYYDLQSKKMKYLFGKKEMQKLLGENKQYKIMDVQLVYEK